MKRLAKKLLIPIVSFVGHRLFTASQRAWLCHRIVPRLLDPRVLPPGLVERPLRRLPVRVWCNPYIYTHWNSFWCGVFFEEGVEAYLLREIKPGDTFIDVGANVGHVSIPAAALVGPSGQVLAFEPNPELAQLTADLASRQNLRQLHMHTFGLGEEPAELTLHLNPEHPGGATMRELVDDEHTDPALFTREVRCEVRVGDRALAEHRFTGRVCLKVDVEGFEMHVLRGLRTTLQRVDHAILEVTPEWIGGQRGVNDMFTLMGEAGLTPHALNDDGTVGAVVSPAEVAGQINVVFRRDEPARALVHPVATTQKLAVPSAIPEHA